MQIVTPVSIVLKLELIPQPACVMQVTIAQENQLLLVQLVALPMAVISAQQVVTVNRAPQE